MILLNELGLKNTAQILEKVMTFHIQLSISIIAYVYVLC